MSSNKSFPYRRRILYGCLACSLLVGGGCGGSGPPRAAVTGQVTIDGVAIDDGTISFSPTDGNTGATAGGNIKNGEYSIQGAKSPAIGMNLITIYGGRRTGKKVANPAYDGRLMDEIVSVVPDRYGARSTLKRELMAGKNVLNLELSSK